MITENHNPWVYQKIPIFLDFILNSLSTSKDFKEQKCLPSLSDTYGLLLHCFMDTGSVMLFEAIKFVNTAKASICKHQGPSLQIPFSWVFYSCYCETWGNKEAMLTFIFKSVSHNYERERTVKALICTQNRQHRDAKPGVQVPEDLTRAVFCK